MSFRLSPVALNRAIEHLCNFGDTDVFPHLPELTFFSDETLSIVDELKKLDLDSYNPEGAVEALGPKSRYSFRITHQLSALDSVLLLAAVVEIGEEIESLRQSPRNIEAFSYRFDRNGEASLFLKEHTYKDWLNAQMVYLNTHPKVNTVAATDISDFYARINFHRLENLLDEAASGHGATRYIKKAIQAIRGKQSFGLPVGGAAARILAELALVDTDTALKDQEISTTRFVDDFRLFLDPDQHPYDAISFLAQHLGINEGLSLNAAKTNVYTRKEYLEHLKELTNDIADEAEGQALDTLTSNIYFDDEPDPDDLEALRNLNLVEFLDKEIANTDYDVGRIRVIFRALRIAKPFDAIDYIKANFSELVVFAKELVLLMEVLERDNPKCFADLTQDLIFAILKPPASSVQIIRTWLLELFVRDIVPLTTRQLKSIETLPYSILDKRQLHIIRGRLGNRNYFRQNKTNVGQLPRLEQFPFVAGATCLPKDEFGVWISSLRPILSAPTCNLFLKWVRANKTDVGLRFGDGAIIYGD